ncbi:hypothetical protein DDT91_18890 [Algoriphagus sp. AK58]|nr:hypothetical protein [Algoriphagus sp. AK58]
MVIPINPKKNPAILPFMFFTFKSLTQIPNQVFGIKPRRLPPSPNHRPPDPPFGRHKSHIHLGFNQVWSISFLNGILT